MTMQRSVRLVLAGAIALALAGTAAAAAAQPATPQPAAQQMPSPPPPPPPPPPAPPQPPTPPSPPMTPTPPQAAEPADASGGFYQGTETTATYALPDSNGGTLTVRAGMPAHVQDYGPAPEFSVLDSNHDGRISEQEAAAYPPLDSDFLFASRHGKYITRAQYDQWVGAER